MNKHSKQKENLICSKNHVKSVVNEWDPLGLLKMGAPENEYDYEIDDILVALQKTKNSQELVKNISKFIQNGLAIHMRFHSKKGCR